MKIIKTLSTILLLSITFLSAGQNNKIKPSVIEVVPHWKKNDIHSIIIRCTTTDIVKTKPIFSLTTFDANFKVLESNDTNYLIEWNYVKAKIAENDPNYENNILAKLLNTNFIVKLSNFGKFIELVNATEIRIATNKALDELSEKELNPNMKVQYNGVKQMVTTQQGLEIALCKYIKIYNFSFGYEYTENLEQTNNVKFPNPLGGGAFDAVEKVKLININPINSTCKIETSKIVEGKNITKAVLEFLFKNNPNHTKEIEQEFGNMVFEITENTMQELNFEKGILKKSSFNRKMNLGILDRNVLMEIETIE